LNFKRNFYGQFPSKICKNSKTLTGAGIPAGQKFSTGTGPAVYRYRFHLCGVANITIKSKSNSSQFAYGIIFDGSTPKELLKKPDEAQ
jgi:hypothetical protein